MITHVREGDGLPKLVPAVACAALVAWYLVLLADLWPVSAATRPVSERTAGLAD
ncbi:hypothetical protein [Streptomyces sp. NPDC048665]|uniref:hypothetical protein n=1 Tax=Streptomyces sp. NPDC048665 TaxID=3155490 RepID=UPI003440BDDD